MTPTAINQRAEELLLADLDGFTDWLGGACFNQHRVELGFIPSDPASLQELIDGMTVPQLLALALYPGKGASGAAMWELRSRYVKASDKYLSALADEVAADEAEVTQ